MKLDPSAKAITSVALALGTFMQVLDSTIANVSIPTISGNLGVSPDQGTWVITSFAVANGVSVPLTGWLMQRYGVVRTFVFSVLMFTVASFLCGIAWSLPSLVAFRVLQGAVSGPMIPGSQALLIGIFPPEKRGAALAIWSITTLVAPICGPILGGYISDNYTWPWIFFINLPVGLFSAFICWRSLGKSETPTRQLPIDTVGLGLMVTWIGALQIMLDRGKDLDWFASTQIVVLAIIAVVGLIAFIIWELTEQHPIVDLSLFKNWNFTLGTIAMCFGYAVFFGNVVLLPLWLQTQIGYTATWAGLVAAPSGVVAVLISPFVGKYLQRTDARWFAIVAFVAFGTSYFMRAGYVADGDFWSFVMPMLVQGFAMGTFFIALVSIALHGLAPERVPAASGMTNFLRITAGSFATSITTTFWDRHEALHQTRLAEATSIYDPALTQPLQELGSHGLTLTQSVGVLTRGLVNQAYLMSSLDFFWISGWISFALIGVILLARPTHSHGPVTAAAD
ncbi:MAG: DHA2 family efflux MFS transporter permease subunit [Nevskiaceae bacterium]|nr:MAG: DHA2 family efflux MFS transporter permease subunit [Nevskiaceae bacterium]